MARKPITQLTQLTTPAALDLIYTVANPDTAPVDRKLRLADLLKILFFDVRAFGAIGDGTTDDRTSIQNTISAAIAAGGGIVYLPPATYKLSNYLTLDDGVTLLGAGSLSVLKPVYGSAINRVIENDWTNGNSNITLKNFRIDRTGTNVQHGILLNGVTNLLIDGIEIVGTPSAASGALAISGIGPTTQLVSKNIRVVNCYFADTDNFGVQAGFVDNCVIANNVFDNCFREAIGVEPETGDTAKNVSIANNTITTPGTSALGGSHTAVLVAVNSSGGTVQDVSIVGNTIRCTAVVADSALSGIFVLGVSGCSVKGNTLRDLNGNGIQIGSGTAATSAAVIGNTCIGCGKGGVATGRAGIYLRNGEYSTVTGNYCESNATYDYEETANAGHNVVAGNIFKTAAPAVSAVHATTRVHDNDGWVTENSGTGSVASGATTAVITHGLSVTPTVDDISITFAEQGTADYGRWWVNTITSTQFTLNVSVDPGVSNLDFGWSIRVHP